MRAFALAILLSSLGSPSLASAQADGVAPLVLLLPAGTRAQALGGAGVALTDADAILHNPAQLTAARGMGISVQRYGGAATLGTLAATTQFMSGGIGMGVQWLDYEIEPGDALPRPDGEPALLRPGSLAASELVASIGYARTYRGFRAGIAAKFAEVREVERDGTFAVDVGIARSVGRVMLGLTAQNLGPAIELRGEDHALPRRYTIGAAVQGIPLGTWFDLAGSVAYPVYEDGTALPGAGVELSYVPIDGVVISGRGGVRLVSREDESALTLGAAFGFDGVYVEYAFQGFEGEGSGHRVGIRVVP